MPTRRVLALLGKCCKVPCVAVSTALAYFEGGELKKTMFWKVSRWVGWVLGPSKGSEGLKMGHDIILPRLLK